MTYKKFDDLINTSYVLMERFEDLLRLELFRTIEVLSEIGYVPSFTAEEERLKFGLHPFHDFIGEGEGYQRSEEYKRRELGNRRIDKATKKYLKDFLEKSMKEHVCKWICR